MIADETPIYLKFFFIYLIETEFWTNACFFPTTGDPRHTGIHSLALAVLLLASGVFHG
jgi:hypothetical protein